MPEIEIEQQKLPDGVEEKKGPSTAKSVVSIIYPPPEVRSIQSILM